MSLLVLLERERIVGRRREMDKGTRGRGQHTQFVSAVLHLVVKNISACRRLRIMGREVLVA